MHSWVGPASVPYWPPSESTSHQDTLGKIPLTLHDLKGIHSPHWGNPFCPSNNCPHLTFRGISTPLSPWCLPFPSLLTLSCFHSQLPLAQGSTLEMSSASPVAPIVTHPSPSFDLWSFSVFKPWNWSYIPSCQSGAGTYSMRSKCGVRSASC